MSSPPWLDLPDHLTDDILERLPLSDYLRFPAVCRKWRSIQTDHRRRHAPTPPPMLKLPWFIPCQQRRRRGEEKAASCCYSPFEGRTYRIKIPRCVLTVPNCGWLVRPGAVFNPISRVEIPFPEPLGGGGDIVAVSPPPDLAVFVVTYGGDLFVFRLGDPHWTQLRLPVVKQGQDFVIAAVASGRKLYCLCSLDEVPCPSYFVLVDAAPTPPTVSSYQMEVGLEGVGRSMFSWMVESDGVILMVNKGSPGFRVFREDASRRTWMRVRSLGDRLLILHSLLSSVSLLAADVGLKKNCIYYSMGSGYGYFKWRVFDLDAGTETDAFFPNDSLLKLDGNLLFIPGIC